MPRFALPLLILLPVLAAAQESKFSLTIYSTADPATFDPKQIAEERKFDPTYRIPGYGVVREIRKITLTKGDNTLKFSDVAAGIDATTVSFKSLTAPDTTSVLEQNFEYDVVSPDKLLEKYLGRSVIINRKLEPLPGDKTRMPETIEAKLLAFTHDQLVLQTNNKQLPVQVIARGPDISEIKLFDLNTGLITKPTLVWKVSAEQAGDHEALVSYQTDNLTWRADYSLVVDKDDSKADLTAWVTVVNESGAAYPNAKLKLVAGDVQRMRPPEIPRSRGGGGGGGLFGGADTGFKEKAFFEYHLYTLGRPTTIANNSTKQIELFPPKSALPVTKTYVYSNPVEWIELPSEPYTERDLRMKGNRKVDVYLKLTNSEKNKLGIPLPAGRMRVYKRDQADMDDPAGQLEFVGEDKIEHTPKDEEVMVRLGSAFDVVGQRKQTDFTVDVDKKEITESFEIKLRNHKTTPVTVTVREVMYRWSQWTIEKASAKHEKHDSRTIHFPIDLAPDAEQTITYTVKYTW